MKYPDGTEMKPGDVVQIDVQYRGRVIASMDTGEYLPGQEHWSYLAAGVMIDTDYGGLVHYTSETADEFVLVSRTAAA